MTGTLILVAAGLLLAAALLRVARGKEIAVRSLQDLEGLTQPVDMAGLRNLIDPAEEEFLRRHLSPAAFRAVERQRLRAAAEYVRRAGSNAAILLRLGETVAQQGDPETGAAAREMANDALGCASMPFWPKGCCTLGFSSPEQASPWDNSRKSTSG